MAQGGDTITYTYSDGSVVSEDISSVEEITVDYCDGSGGESFVNSGGAGGRVENATIDVSGESTLYIWVGGITNGRYSGGTEGGDGGGSTEISVFSGDESDSSDEPFLVAAGGGGGPGAAGSKGSGGAREGSGANDGSGIAPPKGGDSTFTDGEDGQGAIDDRNRGLVSGGTTITGGGSNAGAGGEIQISYILPLSPPDPPSNLSAEVQ